MVSIPAYRPVIRTTRGPYRAAALVGTHSISLGWDVDPAHATGLHGFAVRKSEVDLVSGEVIAVNWLRGEKRFKGDPVDGYDVSSREAPFQRFRWSDYTLKSGLGYVFDIFPVRGTPPDGLTTDEPPLTLKLRSSPELAAGVGAYVNRGVTSAFAYLDRFKGAHPRDVPDGAAWRWLSRGLKEALIGFIEGAGGGHALRVGIYEFFDDEVAAALAAAKARGVDVQIVYHAKPGDHATHKSETVLAAHGLTSTATPRAAIQKISHNKFVVQLVGGVPVRTFTGTANFSENAFYYQTNAAVILDDPGVAAAYHDYWLILADDPPRGPSKSDPAEVRNRVGALQARLAAAGGGPFATQYFSPVTHARHHRQGDRTGRRGKKLRPDQRAVRARPCHRRRDRGAAEGAAALWSGEHDGAQEGRGADHQQHALFRAVAARDLYGAQLGCQGVRQPQDSQQADDHRSVRNTPANAVRVGQFQRRKLSGQ